MSKPTTPARERRGIGYIRVSRLMGRDKVDNGDSFIAAKVQRAEIERLAQQRGIKIVAWYEDFDQSGGKDNRPGYQAALEQVEAGDADVMLVAKLSRFSRSVPGMYAGLKRLEEAGGGMMAADVDFDTTTAMGRMILTIVGAVVQMELELARENWHTAKQVAAGSGKYPGRLPLGYRRNGDKRIEVDPQVAPALVEMFHGRAEGRSYTVLAEAFSRQTGRPLQPRTVEKIMRNVAYKGELVVGGGLDGLRVEPIVSPAEWEAAQKVRTPRAARGQVGSLLAGILRCGSCGQPMTFRGGKQADYTCQRFKNGSRCPAPVLVAGARVDEYVERLFLDAYAAGGAQGEPSDESELGAAERELEVAVADLEATLALDLAGAAADALQRTVATKQERVARAELALDELRSSSRLESRLEQIGERWPELVLEERRRLLAAAIESVTVHRVGPDSKRKLPVEERTTVVFAGEPAATSGGDRGRA